MNPNIANERKTGPLTEMGKEKSRLNGLKTGHYSKLVAELSCNFCKRSKQCEFYQADGKCSLRGKIVKQVLLENLDATEEMKRLYVLSLGKFLESLYFDAADANQWANTATKQLEALNKIRFAYWNL